MSEQTIKMQMQQDLEKKLEHLCFIHDQRALFVANEFYELRNSIDIETEELLARIRESKLDDEADKVTKANDTRSELIRILQELEERCLSQLPKTISLGSSEVYGYFRTRIDQLKTCPSDQLKDVYVKLALELLDKIHELEKRLFGEQTVFYVSPSDKSQLGNLIFIEGVRLRRHESECLRNIIDSARTRLSEYPFIIISFHLVQFLNDQLQKVLLAACNRPSIVDQNYMIISRLVFYLHNENMKSLPQFIYTTKYEKSGYSVESSLIDIELVGYRFPPELKGLIFNRIGGFSQDLDVLDFLSADKCGLEVSESHLQSLDFLSSTQPHRLEALSLTAVHLERFDGSLLANCINLKWFKLDIYGPGIAITSLDFLRQLKKLEWLFVALADFDLDFSVLQELHLLKHLVLSGSFDSSGKQTRPKLNLDSFLKQIRGFPSLAELHFLSLEVDKISKHQFVDFMKLRSVKLYDMNGCHIETNNGVNTMSSGPNEGLEIRILRSCKSKIVNYFNNIGVFLVIII